MKNFTKYLLLASTLLALNFTSFGQEPNYQPGTENYLLVKRGFKIFKLGESINTYSKYVKFIRDEHETQEKTYLVTDQSLLSVGNDIKLSQIIISTYKDNILSISIFITKPYIDQFLSILQAAYGLGNQPNRFIKEYRWSSYNNEIILSYDTEAMRNKALAMFLDKNISAKQKKEKQKRAEKDMNQI